MCADHPPQVFAGCLLSSGVHVAGSRHIGGASAPGLSQAAYTVQMENGGVNPPGLDSCMTARGMPPPTALAPHSSPPVSHSFLFWKMGTCEFPQGLTVSAMHSAPFSALGLQRGQGCHQGV